MKRNVVGAHYGLTTWIAQRATAVLMAVYTVIFLVAVLAVQPGTVDAWRGIFASWASAAARWWASASTARMT